ncbi:MAG: hypothetical protein E6G39_14230 [Actinobacteria bacterium]|nr:MAG: hypothetical protein E6G39_14230 [Actinomycetota bacterium]
MTTRWGAASMPGAPQASTRSSAAGPAPDGLGSRRSHGDSSPCGEKRKTEIAGFAGRRPLSWRAVAEPIVDYSRPKGTRDILPPESQRWRRLVGVFADVVEGAGYGLVVPPMFEHVEVFHRLGEATDVVAKEMYEFTDRGGRRLALRPEQTASVVRMFVENRPTVPWKVWYAGSNFRAENVQRGRYRQFDQVGIEVLGVDDPYLDVEVIALAWRFFQRLGLCAGAAGAQLTRRGRRS